MELIAEQALKIYEQEMSTAEQEAFVKEFVFRSLESHLALREKANPAVELLISPLLPLTIIEKLYSKDPQLFIGEKQRGRINFLYDVLMVAAALFAHLPISFSLMNFLLRVQDDLQREQKGSLLDNLKLFRKAILGGDAWHETDSAQKKMYLEVCLGLLMSDIADFETRKILD